MSDGASALPAAAPVQPSAAAKPPGKPWFTFTDDGCRSDLRLGALLVSAAVFLWLFLGPANASLVLLPGLLLLLVSVPLQAIQARRGRPGYPWKLGLGMAGLAAAMAPDQVFRMIPGGELRVQDIAWYLGGAGGWILLWWPLARAPRLRVAVEGRS